MDEDHKYENFDLFHWSDPYYNGSFRYYLWNGWYMLLILFYRDREKAKAKLDSIYYRVHHKFDKLATWVRTLLLWLVVTGLVLFFLLFFGSILLSILHAIIN